MSVSETRIVARDTSGVEVYCQHSTLPTKENVEAYESFHKGAAKIMLDMAIEDQKQYWVALLGGVKKTQSEDVELAKEIARGIQGDGSAAAAVWPKAAQTVPHTKAEIVRTNA